jgi:membrane protease YdiL (CAAX protease family)
MSKTFKLCAIFLITVVSLLVFRIVMSVINLSDNIAEWLFTLVYQVGCLGFLPWFLYRSWIQKDNKSYLQKFRISFKVPPLAYAFALLIAILSYFLNVVISSFSVVIFTGIGYTYSAAVNTIYSSPEVLFFDIIASAILPAIFEEIAHRGMLVGILDDVKTESSKILIIGILFGLVHQNVTQFPAATLIGIVLAYMAIKSQSIIPGMIVHFLNNFILSLQSYSYQRGKVFYNFLDSIFDLAFNNLITLIMSTAFCAFLLITILKQFTKLCSQSNTIVGHETKPGMQSENTVSDSNIEVPPSLTTENEISTPFSYESLEFEEIFYSAKVSAPTTSFQIPSPTRELKEKILLRKDYYFLHCAIGVTIVSVIFTFIWGLLR